MDTLGLHPGDLELHLVPVPERLNGLGNGRGHPPNGPKFLFGHLKYRGRGAEGLEQALE